MVCSTWTKTSLFALSFGTIELHIEQKVFLQHSFIFGHMAMKHPYLGQNSCYNMPCDKPYLPTELHHRNMNINPRPAGVWLVTRPAGGGGGPKGPPLKSPKLLDRFPNFKRHSIALYVNYLYKVKNLTRRSLMTSQVRSKSEFSTFRAW